MPAERQVPPAHHLIFACAASADAAMQAAARAVDLPGTDASVEVEIFPGTRGGRTVTVEERDRLARNFIAQVRHAIGGLIGLYPTGPGAVVLPESLIDALAGKGKP